MPAVAQGRIGQGRIEQVLARAYTVPTDAPEQDGTADWDATTIVVVQVRSGDLLGTGWTYGVPACARIASDLLAPVVVGQRVADVPACWAAMVRAARNATRAGAVGYAISAMDVALWDLKARSAGLSLADLFGRAREQVPVYGSGGFTSYDDDRLTAQLEHWRDQGMSRVKIKIGRPGGSDHDRDVHRMSLARTVIGPQVELFVDANGAYQAGEAVRAWHAAQAAGADVSWFEEPVSSDDLAGLRHVRSKVSADVAAGEYGTDLGYFQRMCAAEAVDCLQVDATRCGGYTAWLKAAAVAASHHLQVSGHCAPNLHAHVGLATANLRHLEWFHDHVRIEQMLFDGALDPAGGCVRADLDSPGHGLTLRDDVAQRYRVG